MKKAFIRLASAIAILVLSTGLSSCEDGSADNDYVSNECAHANITSTVIDPDCINEGYSTYTCSECGYSYNGNITSTIGHVSSEWKIQEKATCDKCKWNKPSEQAESRHNTKNYKHSAKEN